MKILYFGDAASIHTQRWVRYFAGHGCDVAVVTKRGASFDGIHVINVSHISGLLRLMEIHKIVSKFKPDIVHAHYVTSYGFWGALSGFHPFVLTGWGTDILVTPRKSLLMRLLTRFTLRRADLITADAQEMVPEMENIAGNDRDIRIVQWGVDLALFNPEGRDAERKKLGWQGKFIVLSTRSLEPIYNVNAIITAFTRMAARVPIAELVIVGEGSKRDILQKQASASGLDKRIRFLGSVPYGEMAGLYKAADVFVSIPASDATAMSLLEAMSCGLPVIVSDLPANREWISEGLNGSLVDPADLERMSQCMEEPFRNSALRTTYGSVNVAAIQEKANHDREMERMMEFYRSLVPRKKRH